MNLADEKNTKLMRKPHLHQDYEIYFLVEGERLYYIDGKEYCIRKNQLVFIDKNMLHKTSKQADKAHKRIVINFHKNYLSDPESNLLQHLFEDGPSILSLPESHVCMFRNLYAQMLREYKKDRPEKDIYLRALVIQLLVESKRLLNKELKASRTTKKALDRSTMSEMIRFIHQNYNKDLSLQILSDRFHLNEHYISRMFKQATNYSFTDYVNRFRVAEAERLLKETEWKINHIANYVGYSTNVHFNRVFKSIIGISPNQYRKKNTSGLIKQ